MLLRVVTLPGDQSKQQRIRHAIRFCTRTSREDRRIVLCSVVRPAGGSNGAIEWSDPAALLRELVEKIDADLAVFGAHGRSALLRAFVGSVARRIAQFLPCDALLIPHRAGIAKPNRIEQLASKPNRHRRPRQES